MLKRKDKIIISAIELLGKEGINGITMKNIANKQKVSEPALYKQFKSKNEIIHHIVSEYESFDKQIQNTIMQSDLKGKEAIMFYVTRYAELYENYFELTTIMLSMDLYFYNEDNKKIKNDVRCNRKLFLRSLIEIYLKSDYTRTNLDGETLCTCIEGIIMKEVMDWRLEEKKYKLKDKIIKTVDKLL